MALKLNLSTFQGDPSELRPALRIECNRWGLVQMAALDPAYEPLMFDLVNEGFYSNELERTVYVEDGDDFVRAVGNGIATSSYWVAEFPGMAR